MCYFYWKIAYIAQHFVPQTPANLLPIENSWLRRWLQYNIKHYNSCIYWDVDVHSVLLDNIKHRVVYKTVQYSTGMWLENLEYM